MPMQSHHLFVKDMPNSREICICVVEVSALYVVLYFVVIFDPHSTFTTCNEMQIQHSHKCGSVGFDFPALYSHDATGPLVLCVPSDSKFQGLASKTLVKYSYVNTCDDR